MGRTYSNSEILFLMIGSTIGYSLISIPKVVAEYSGTGGWFSLLLATIITMGINYINIHLAYCNESKTLPEYSKKLLGKKIYVIIMIIYIVHFFLIATYDLRITSEIMKANVLLRTPCWVLTLVFAITVGYALMKGFKTILLVSQIYGIIIILTFIITHIFISTEGSVLNVVPIFDAHSVGNYIKGIFSSSILFSLSGSECISYIALNKRKNKKIHIQAIFITALIGFIYILVFESCISVMGVQDIVFYEDSVISTIRRVELPYLQFLRRLDGVFIVNWLTGAFTTAMFYLYGVVYFFQNITKNKITKNKIIFGVVIIAWLTSGFPKKSYLLPQVNKYISYFSIIAYIIIPVILLFLTKVNKNEKI
ncbi:endospore germination permease [Clostridium oceanicum]|uniref:Spore germination protein YndE n=1 Tax=Clostridium oceanicum TaxID=1543 RepID=A0ABN1JII3_9CLOT